MDVLGFMWPGHVGWVQLGVHPGFGPVWPYRGDAGPGLRVAKAALALVHQGVQRVAGGLVAFRPDLVFTAESGHPLVARGLDWLSGWSTCSSGSLGCGGTGPRHKDKVFTQVCTGVKLVLEVKL